MSAQANEDVARALGTIAGLLEAQGASARRVSRWRAAAGAILDSPRRLSTTFAAGGLPALEAMPAIGRALAAPVAEILATGRSRLMDRLRGVVPAVDAGQLPGVGPVLARRVRVMLGIDTLEELEEAARDGRLLPLRGFGGRRVEALAELVATRLGRRGRPRPLPPPVALLLDIDRRFREMASGGEHSVLHEEREGWEFTALYANTPVAIQRGMLRDWVAIYHERDGDEGMVMVVTETANARAGSRVVRGRELEGSLPSYDAMTASI